MVVHSRTIGFLLNYLRDLEAISVHVERIAALQQAYSRLVPEELSQASRVGYQTGERLVLTADSGTAAAKLRMLAPRIAAGLKRTHPWIGNVRVEVVIPQRTTRAPAPLRRIGATGIGSLQQLAEGLPRGPVQAAVRRLLRNQQTSNRGDDLLEREKAEHDPDEH